MAAEKKKSTSAKRLEWCGIIAMLILGVGVAIALIVYLVENKPMDSKFKTKDPAVVKTPFEAVNSGVKWLREQQTGDMWPMGQSADAILALRLGNMAQFHTGNCELRLAVKSAEFDILSAMLQQKDLLTPFWGKGLLAKYIVALRSTCADVRDFHSNDLIQILANQYAAYKNYYNGDRKALAWYTLALCTANNDTGDDIIQILTRNGAYSMGVAEASMVAIALTCLDTWNMTMYGTEIMMAHDYLIDQQRADGSFGDEFQTALALQALLNSNHSRLSMIRDKGLEYLSNLIQGNNKGAYRNLAAASHIMTALGGKSFADAKVNCEMKAMTTLAPGEPMQITVKVKGGVVNASLEYAYNVTINKGQSLYAALETLQAMQMSSFMFTSALTSNGRMILSLQGIELEMNSLQYWKIMEGTTDKTSEGVSYINPKANMMYTFEAATYSTS